jgi:hypothetical protein
MASNVAGDGLLGVASDEPPVMLLGEALVVGVNGKIGGLVAERQAAQPD